VKIWLWRLFNSLGEYSEVGLGGYAEISEEISEGDPDKPSKFCSF